MDSLARDHYRQDSARGRSDRGPAPGGGDPKLLLLDLMEQIRNTLLHQTPQHRNAGRSCRTRKKTTLWRNLARICRPEDLHLLVRHGLKGAQDLTRASDPLLVLEMVLLRMTGAPRVGKSLSGRAQISGPSAIPAGPKISGSRQPASVSGNCTGIRTRPKRLPERLPARMPRCRPPPCRKSPVPIPVAPHRSDQGDQRPIPANSSKKSKK